MFLVASVVLLTACTSKPSAPPVSISQNTSPMPTITPAKQEPISNTPPVEFKELKSYRIDNQLWRAIVIPPNLEKEKLMALARYLHRTDPTTSFHIFDDDNAKEYKKLVDSDIHYQDESYPYPEAWLQQHNVAMINKMLERGGARWQLIAMDAGTKYAPDIGVIAELE